MRQCRIEVGLSVMMRAVGLGLLPLLSAGAPTFAQDAGGKTGAATDATGGEGATAQGQAPTLESQFSNYLHFALIGRFDVADQMFGQPLVNRPELNPLTDEAAEALVALTEKYKDSIDILLTLVQNSTIGDNAQKLLKLIHDAHKHKRMNPAEIKSNIDLLDGDRVQRAVGLERLIESGEYAVPWLLATLGDPRQKEMRQQVAWVLPQLPRSAVNPLVAALAIEDEASRATIIEVLGQLGYPPAIPYLQRIATNPQAGDSIRQAAAAAIRRIARDDPTVAKRPAADLFYQLAEKYYDNEDSLRPDPREDRANVWYFRKDMLPGQDPVEPIEVPREIFTLVMAMRCCEASLTLDLDRPGVVALWLAADFRREARLGLDVESEETVDSRALDGTRPDKFPRSIYWARVAGPNCCQIVLRRAIEDRDREVALGAIAALSSTAGPPALVAAKDPGGTSLAEALFFPDLLVRLKAALALGHAMPTTTFRGAAEVVPVLASALTPTEKTYYLVVDPQEASRQQVEEGLVTAGASVVAADQFAPALDRAHKTLTHLDGVFLASDVKRPTAIEAVRQLAQDDRFALTPIVILIKPGDTLFLERVAEVEGRVGTLFVDTANGATIDVNNLLARKDQVAARLGHRALSPEMKLDLALQAARTLQAIAARATSVFDVSVAEKTLIDTLMTHASEELRISAAAVLSWLNTESAQEAIAAAALGDRQTESLRMAAFAALADSARRFGSHLDQATTDRLVSQAFEEPNLALRTAASQALGAINVPGRRAAEIIVGQTRG